MPTVAAFIFTTHIRLGARLPEIGAILYFVQAASSQSVPMNKSKFHIAAMFVLRTSRYAAPVKFTLFALHIKLALKIYAVAIKVLVKFTLFTRRYFVPQIQPRRLLANSIKFKRIRFQRPARVKFENLILPKPPFQLGFVGTRRICVVAGLGKRRGCICRARSAFVRSNISSGSASFSEAISS